MHKVNEVWSQTGAPVWDKGMSAASGLTTKTTEIVGQVVEKSSESVEKTKVMMSQVTADMQPAAAKVKFIIQVPLLQLKTFQISDGAVKGWHIFSETAVSTGGHAIEFSKKAASSLTEKIHEMSGTAPSNSGPIEHV